MQGGITYEKSGCQEIGRICYGSNFNQVLEKEKNRLIHQYDKELTDFKKEYKSQAAYDKENGYASIRCADAGKDRSGCYEGSGESRTCADYRNLKRIRCVCLCAAGCQVKSRA